MTVRAKRFGKWLLGARILRVRWLPHGLDLALDLKRRAPDLAVNLIFDVGANEGQSARAFARAFPNARIVSFEPATMTYSRLRANTSHLPQVRCVQAALGASPGTAQLALAPQSVNNSLLDNADDGSGIETVRVDTVDAVAASFGIAQIDYLKVDTEGFDLEVLKGAEQLLRSGQILLVEVEAGMTSRNTKHVPFEVLKAHLEARDYVLFGLYEQTPEWSGEPRLRFANAVFMLGREAHRIRDRLHT